MKYVILRSPTTNYIIPVVFDDAISHNQMVPEGWKVSSAGFVKVKGITQSEDSRSKTLWEASGGSTSLKIPAKPKRDSFILTQFLNDGVSGLELMNLLTFLKLQKLR